MISEANDYDLSSPKLTLIKEIYMKPSDCCPIHNNTVKHSKDYMSSIEKFAFFMRKATVPPILAVLLTTLMWLGNRELIGNISNLFMSYVFLAVMPILAYPVHAVLPFLRKRGRKCQRNLAILFSTIGYIAGSVYSLIVSAPNALTIVYLTYLFSGIFIAVFTFAMKFKASGHAAGIAGPVTVLAVFVSPWYIFAYILALPVLWCSVKTKRHSVSEFLVGCLCPIVSMLIAMAIVL